MEITSDDWKIIRRIFRDGFASSSYFGVASVGGDGSPHITPIGSFVLGDVGHAFYFEEYAGGLAHRLQSDQRVCVMAVNGSRWELLKALWRGQVRRPFGVRLYGTVGERRDATEVEVERFQRRVRHMRFLRGHRLLWGKMRTVRDVRFHRFDPVRIAPLGDPWPLRRPATLARALNAPRSLPGSRQS
jgi:hypothetical protein